MKFCSQDILKTLIAMNFKLGRWVDHLVKFKKKFFLFFPVIAHVIFIILDMHVVGGTVFLKHNF